MLFGKILKQSTPYSFNPDILDTEDVGPVLSIYNIALGPENQSQTSLWVKKNGEQFLIANLNKEKPHASIEINLFIQDEAELFVKGQGAIHIVGSFETGEQPFDSQNLYGDEDISQDDEQQQLQNEEDDQEEDDESEEVAAPLSKNVTPKSQVLKHVNSNDKKVAPAPIVNSKNSPAPKSLIGSSKLNENIKSLKPQQINNDQDSDNIDSLDSFIDDQDIIDDIEIDDSISDDDHPSQPSKLLKTQPQKSISKTQNKPFDKSSPQGNKNNQNKGKPFKKH